MKRNSYHPLQIWIHWVVFLLVLASIASVQLHELIPKGSEIRTTLVRIHMLMGQLIFITVVIRLLARFLIKEPERIQMSQWQVYTSKLVQLALYIWMFILPISGVVFVQAGGREIQFFTMVLPQFITPDPSLKNTIKEIHEFLGESIYYLIGIHAIAALWHHYVQKDDVLKRMSLRK